MKKTEPPSPEEFDALLAWLDPDRECAGETYEEIRRKLMKIMVWRQCYAAEELADETINRVSHKVKDIALTYVGNPALYFNAVLRYVYKEWLHNNPPIPIPPVPPPEPDPDVEQTHWCLDDCLQKLDPEVRDLILDYYAKDGQAKIKHRKELANKRGMTMNGLRMQVHRINARLEVCIVSCLKDAGATESRYVPAG